MIQETTFEENIQNFESSQNVDEFELNCIYSRSETRFLGYNTPVSLRLHRILQIP